ncbi:hypothetical protein YC2023_085358 [Brassica napus]
MNTGTYITSVKHQERTTFSEPSLTKIILPLQGLLTQDAEAGKGSECSDAGESSLGLESTRLSFDDIFSILQVKRNIYFNHGDTGFKLYVGINGFPRQLYCFIPLPLALNLKTRDWIRVIIGGVFPAGANVAIKAFEVRSVSNISFKLEAKLKNSTL